MHTKMIEKIIAEGTPDQMCELKQMLICLIDDLKTENPHEYLRYECKLHKIIYGNHIGKEVAEYWTSHMTNKDGTKGAHWTIDQTSQVLKDKGYRFDKYDWYAVLNMVYSDNFNSRFDLNIYAELANDWLSDADVSKNKLLDYYYYVVCKK